MAYCDIISIERPPVTRGEFLDIKRINVISCTTYPDCSYKERVELSFVPCGKDGMIYGVDNKKRIIVKLDIETGYIPFSETANAMKAALISKVKNIRNIDILIKAFQYRKYYCEV
jgi:hypothetical protein